VSLLLQTAVKSIRQSRVTGVLDVTNIATFVTQALDEYTFRHGRFKFQLWALRTQFMALFGFKSHKYHGSEQAQQQKMHFLHHSKIC
jgi:hypothetical protein